MARTGKQAFEMTLAHKPDLVFMDLFMPELNGDDACRKIKEHPETRTIPVVMVTQGGREDELRITSYNVCYTKLLRQP